MSNWKPFYLDTNVAFGFVDAEEKWKQMILDTSTQPSFGSVEAAERYLLETRRFTNTDNPLFGFPNVFVGETLAEFLGK